MSDLLSYGRIFAVFDCCRVKLDNMPGLVTGRGLGNGDIEDDEGSDESAMCKYFHLQACGPGGIADADGGFAHRLLEACNKFSERAPKGYLELPRDILRIKWAPGETTNTGGDDYLVPFGAIITHSVINGYVVLGDLEEYGDSLFKRVEKDGKKFAMKIYTKENTKRSIRTM